MIAKLTSSTVVLAGLALIGVVVLLAMQRTVPQELWGVLALLLGGHLALSQPASTADPTPTGSVPAPARLPTGKVAQPGPQ